MKMLLFPFVFFVCSLPAMAQPLVTRTAYTGFFSETPLEDIKAENRQVHAVIDPAKKTIAFAMLMRGFLFEKELMQQHFNEDYIESDKYPKATFSGSYTGNADLNSSGLYPVQVTGSLTLHGVTRTITVPATLEVQRGKITGKASFQLKPADFNIRIPALVRDKIAQQVKVSVLADFNSSN